MTVRLPRLPVNWRDQPQLFERYWDETLFQLEKTLNSILDIPLIQEAVDSAQASANSAQASANSAQASVDTQIEETSLVNSYAEGSSIVSANSAGNITIATHTRKYGDGSSVSVTGSTISTSAVSGDVVRIFYDDPTRAGGAVTYQFTVDPATAPVQSGNRHVVGAALIPSSGTNAGKVVGPPGYIDINLL